MTQGTCTVHTWNDGLDEDEAEPKMGLRVDAKLNHDRKYYDADHGTQPITRSQYARTRLRRRLLSEDEDDE